MKLAQIVVEMAFYDWGLFEGTSTAMVIEVNPTPIYIYF